MTKVSIAILSLLVLGEILLVEGKPTIYMKNENDKLEPLLLPVSSTVIPIPIGFYQNLDNGFGIDNRNLPVKIKFPKLPPVNVGGGTGGKTEKPGKPGKPTKPTKTTKLITGSTKVTATTGTTKPQ